ncbi:MAG: HAD-IIB family hydrolase, partial [Erysipelotrichaceae bacterium]|nr:HAD-IIB family hydrolase [Erysipelotrichaceae bacterium]
MTKLLLFDLDGTLLRTDKTISDRSLQALSRVREAGVLIGVVTSRSEQNCLDFLRMLVPDILISSAGALVKFGKEHVFKAEFTSDEVNRIIDLARRVDPKIE